MGGRLLSYDYFIDDRVLCEFQGQYHDGTANNQTKKQFVKQQEHDRRKREFSKIKGYKFIEIWYWEFNKIEEILYRELNELITVA